MSRDNKKYTFVIDKCLKNKIGVYKIYNIKNGKFYIGSSRNIYNRLREHIGTLRKNKHDNPYLQCAYNKYGEDCFRYTIIEFIEDVNQQYIREQYWLDKLSATENGYNINKSAVMPPDSRGCNNPMYGKHHSLESRRKMSEKRKKVQCNGDNPRAKAVICLNDNIIHDTIKQCAEYYNICRDSVMKNCRGMYVNPKYKFMFYDDYKNKS